MGELKHTPEPWTVEVERSGWLDRNVYNVNSGGECVIGPEGLFICEEIDEANSRRIVACVNACAGIDNATLEMDGTIADIIHAKRAEISRLTAEVERLESVNNMLDVTLQRANGRTEKLIKDIEFSENRAETAKARVRELEDDVERLDTVQGLTYRRAQHAEDRVGEIEYKLVTAEAQLAELRARVRPGVEEIEGAIASWGERQTGYHPYKILAQSIHAILPPDHTALVRQLVEALEKAREFLPQKSSMPNTVRTEIGDAIDAVDYALSAAKEASIE